MRSVSALAFGLIAAAATALAQVGPHRYQRHVVAPVRDAKQSYVRNSTFEQLIDHSNPSLGTFSQFYYYSTEFWKGPGSPVVLLTPGEVDAAGYDGYLNINTTSGLLGQKLGAAVIVLEHRYWGTSSPFDELTTENMQYLTLENSLQDLNYFALNVDLPFAVNASSNADAVPWVNMGGSYAGALAAWLASVHPGTFWAYHASSAPVQAISDYWAYFYPIQRGMPQNCSSDTTLVIDHIDQILLNGTDEEVHDLKTMFNMQDVEHNADFAAALTNGPALWQGNQFYYNNGFFTWCDYVENSVNATGSDVAGPEGVGLEKALAGYAKWFTEQLLPDYCAGYGYDEFDGIMNTACFDTYNAKSPLFTDTSLSNEVDRQWIWMLCNEPFSYWQGGAPEERPTIASRLVTPEYQNRQCGLYFPLGPDGETYGVAQGKTPDDVDRWTGGWDTDNTTRLLYVNGQYDPWRESGVSAELRPNGPRVSTSDIPVMVVPLGTHCSDLYTRNGLVNAGVKAVQDAAIQQLADWVAEWPGASKSYGKA